MSEMLRGYKPQMLRVPVTQPRLGLDHTGSSSHSGKYGYTRLTKSRSPTTTESWGDKSEAGDNLPIRMFLQDLPTTPLEDDRFSQNTTDDLVGVGGFVNDRHPHSGNYHGLVNINHLNRAGRSNTGAGRSGRTGRSGDSSRSGDTDRFVGAGRSGGTSRSGRAGRSGGTGDTGDRAGRSGGTGRSGRASRSGGVGYAIGAHDADVHSGSGTGKDDTPEGSAPVGRGPI